MRRQPRDVWDVTGCPVTQLDIPLFRYATGYPVNYPGVRLRSGTSG